jgi:hypothetical protein
VLSSVASGNSGLRQPSFRFGESRHSFTTLNGIVVAKTYFNSHNVASTFLRAVAMFVLG